MKVSYFSEVNRFKHNCNLLCAFNETELTTLFCKAAKKTLGVLPEVQGRWKRRYEI